MFYKNAQQLWGLEHWILIGWLIKLSVQTFGPLRFVILCRWLSIYRPLSYLFRSLSFVSDKIYEKPLLTNVNFRCAEGCEGADLYRT